MSASRARRLVLWSPKTQAAFATGGAPLLAVLSQCAGLLQLALLLGPGTGRATDGYFLEFTAGSTVASLFVWGVLYPRILSGSLNVEQAKRFTLPLAILAFIVVLCAGLFLREARGYSVEEIGPSIPLGINASLGVVIAVRAAKLSADGDGRAQAAANLFGNLGACILLAPLWFTGPSIRVLGMSLGLILGNAALIVLLRRSDGAPSRVFPVPNGRSTGVGWLLTSSAAGYGAALLLQAAATSLPEGDASYYNVAVRLGGAFVTVMVNPLLPSLVNQGRVRRTRLALLSVLGALITASATLISGLIHRDLAVLLVLGSAWLCVSTTNACMGRLAYRDLPGSAWALPTVAILIAAVSTYVANSFHPSSGRLTAGLLATEAASAAILCLELRAKEGLLVAATVCGSSLAALDAMPSYGAAAIVILGSVPILWPVVEMRSQLRQSTGRHAKRDVRDE